jgi:hypothetical protein
MARIAIIFVRSTRDALARESLSQALGLVAPILFDLWARQDKAKHDKRCDRDEGDNPTHLRSPVMWAWRLEDNAGLLINCSESKLIRRPWSIIAK